MLQTPQAPPAPPVPGVPAPGAVIAGQTVPIPMTRQEVAALRARRSELSNQLNSAQERRDRLEEQLTDASAATRAGLEQRIAVLDQRIVQLELDIAETGRAISSAPAGLAMTAPPSGDIPFGLAPGQVTGITIAFTVFVLFPMAVALAIRLLKRPHKDMKAIPPDLGQRLDRLEHAVDTIAIEMERVSEGQRFVTRVLTEPAAQPLLEASRQAPEVRARERDPVHVRREP